MHGTVTAIGDVLVYSAARLLRDKRGQVRCVTDTQLLDVLRPIGVHRVRAGLFRRGNIRTGHDDALHLSLGSLGAHRRTLPLEQPEPATELMRSMQKIEAIPRPPQRQRQGIRVYLARF